MNVKASKHKIHMMNDDNETYILEIAKKKKRKKEKKIIAK